MRNQIKEVLSGCTPCNRHNVIKEGYHPAKSIEANNTFDHIQMDLIGPFTESEEGYNFIITIVDVFTGYTILRALKNKSENEVAFVLWSVLCEYGFPKIIQSDQGTEFINKVMKEMINLYGVEQRFITAYNPRADGLVERKNKEVSKLIKKYMDGSTQHWQQWLPLIQLSMNSAVTVRTGTAPFALMFARPLNDSEDYTKVDVNLNENVIDKIKENNK